MISRLNRNLLHELVLPTTLFAALGGMTWAVRGCSGFGAMNGCVFAGVTWGAAWWYLAQEHRKSSPRPYSSGWIVLALTIGIGIAGNRGWMQWPSFFEGHLQTNTAEGRWLPIPRSYGFLWLFIAGVPWAGLGACLLAWCNSEGVLGWRGWVLRFSAGLGMAFLAKLIFDAFPEVFLPLYKSISAQYHDLQSNPNLRRLINDNRTAIMHMGLYMGFLLFEVLRKAWRNVALILAVGLLNGIGWAVCQNWRWAAGLWPDAHFNWWRCWESSGGISIGLALGVAYFLTNQNPPTLELDTPVPASQSGTRATLERLGLGLGVILGLGLSIKNGLKGWANIYLGNEEHWNNMLWSIIGPLMLIGVATLSIWCWRRPVPPGSVAFPRASAIVWTVLVIQNVIAQLVTGPLTSWNEAAFSIYYLLLFAISTVIILHFQYMKSLPAAIRTPRAMASNGLA